MRICPDCASEFEDGGAGFCHGCGARLLDASTDPLIGRAVGSYRLVRLLGEGGMGTVYLGVHPNIGSRVAVKLLDANLTSRKDLVDRFFAEAMAVNRIRHENIVNVLDLDTLDGQRPYIIMEFLEGRPLSGVISHFGVLPQGTLIGLAREILGALEAAHKAGIVHRDLKPDNVFVSPQGRAKVLDFGIAKLLPDSGMPVADQFTQTGMVLGTPSYMAPEQIQGGEVTPGADIYSLGVILFEAATGAVPFGGDSLFELLNNHVNTPAPPARSRNPSLSPALEAVISRALSKSAADRFPSAAAMGHALISAAAGLPAEAWASISLVGGEPALVVDPTPRPTPSPSPSPGPATPATNQSPAPPPPAAFELQHPPRVSMAQPVPAAPRKKGRIAIAVAVAAVALIGGAIAAAVLAGDKDKDDAVAASAVAAESETVPETETEPETVPETQPGPEPETQPDPVAIKVKKAKTAGPGKPAPAVRRKDEPKPAPTPVAKKEPEPAKPSGVDIGPGVTVISTADEARKKSGLEAFSEQVPKTRRFDAIAFHSRAQTLARRLMSDAILVHWEVDGVAPSGLANLDIGSNEASYWFRSPSRSARPADLPRGMDVDITCMVYVDVRRGKAEVYPTTSEKCRKGRLRRPRCSLRQVWTKAYAIGAPKGNWIANIDYLRDGWFFDIPNGSGDDDDFTESIRDDC